jgi:hypothetical protein
METDPIARALRLSSTKLPITKASIESLNVDIILVYSSLRAESLDTEESSFQCTAIGWQGMEN